MIINIESIEQFEKEISSGLKIVDFHAKWCGPCRMLAPLLEEYCDENESVTLLKVDCDLLGELAMRYQVMSIPFIITLVDGKKTGENVGFLPRENLFRFLDSALR